MVNKRSRIETAMASLAAVAMLLLGPMPPAFADDPYQQRNVVVLMGPMGNQPTFNNVFSYI